MRVAVSGSTAAAAATAVALRCGREELINRETHLVEQIAGIFARRGAFLVRHTIVVHRHKHLHVANQLHDGKDPERDDHDAAIGTVDEVAAVAIAQLRGNTATVTAIVVAAVAAVDETRIQHDRLGNLHAAVRHIAGRHFLTVALVGAVFAVENPHVTFAAVQNDLLAEDADALYRGARHTVPAVYLDLYVKVEGQVTGIIAAVKG